jgi:hypothetical protein
LCCADKNPALFQSFSCDGPASDDPIFHTRVVEYDTKKMQEENIYRIFGWIRNFAIQNFATKNYFCIFREIKKKTFASTLLHRFVFPLWQTAYENSPGHQQGVGLILL